MAKVAKTRETIAACRKVMDKAGVKVETQAPNALSAILMLNSDGLLVHATVSETNATMAFVDGKATAIAISEYVPTKVLIANYDGIKKYVVGMRYCAKHNAPRLHIGQTHSRCPQCDEGYKDTAATKRAIAQAERLEALVEGLQL